MKKSLTIILIIILTLIMASALFACTNTDDPDNNNTNNGGNTDGGLKEDEKEEQAIVLTTAPQADITISGKVRDVLFNGIAGVEVLFGIEEEEFAAISDNSGEFLFYIRFTKDDFLRYKINDFISLDCTLYDYNVVYSAAGTPYNLQKIDIVCANIDDNIDVYSLISYSNKIAFQESGLPLPDDYQSQESYGGVTEGGQTRLSGIEFYIDGNLVGISDSFGFGLQNILPGTVVTLKKEGFTFVTLVAGGFRPLVAVVDGVEYEDSFIAPNIVGYFPYNIRGVLKEGISIEDLDL